MREAFENQTRIILDSIGDGVFTVDSDQIITSFNRAARRNYRNQKRRGIGSALLGGFQGQHL